MDKLLEKIKTDLDNKILSCVKGESIIRPFTKVFEEVREKQDKTKKKTVPIFPDEESIYKSVIEKFLKENPEFIKEEN